MASPMVGGDGDLSKEDIVIFEETTQQNSMGRDVFALKDALSVLHLYYASEGIRIKDHSFISIPQAFIPHHEGSNALCCKCRCGVGTMMLCVEKPGTEPQAS